MAAADQVLPSVDNTELPPAASAGFDAAGINDVAVIMGPAARGAYTPRVLGASDVADLLSAYGTGRAVKLALYAMTKIAKQVVFQRLPTAAVAATKNAFKITSATLDGFGALSGTPTDGADIVITVTTGGTTGTSFSYTLSTDGGATVGAPVAQGAGLTIVVLGVTLTLTTGKTATIGDTITWWQAPASSTTLPTTFVGTGTSAITVTGTPLDAYEVAFKCVVGGTIATAGITYQVSLDYGAPVPTWSATTALGVATTLLLLDGPVSVESTGLTLHFAAGTLVAGDVFSFNTSAAQYDSAGITAALAALRKANVSQTFVYAVGPITETLGATVASLVAAWGGTSRPEWGVVDARDRVTSESLAAWSARVNTEWTPYTSTYVGYTEGMARVSCPLNGRNNRMPVGLQYLMRWMGYPIFVDAGEFDLGPCSPDTTITDINQTTVEMDANADPSGVEQGALCLRTWPGNIGVYPAKGCLPGPPGNIQRIAVRRVFNVAEIIFFAVLQSQAVKNFRVAKLGAKSPEVVGDLVLADQAKLNRIGNDALKRAITDQGLAGSVGFKVNPTPISLGGDSYKLKASMTLGAFIYVDVLSGTSQLV